MVDWFKDKIHTVKRAFIWLACEVVWTTYRFLDALEDAVAFVDNGLRNVAGNVYATWEELDELYSE